MRSAILIASLLPAMSATVALADDLIVPTKQKRGVSGGATAQDPNTTLSDSDFDQATDFAPFVSSVGVSVSDVDAFSQGGGWQDSRFLPSSIVTKGSHFANSEAYGGEWTADGYGTSEFDVTFTVTAKADFTFTGFVEAYDHGYTIANISDANGDTVASAYSLGGGWFPVSLSGTVDPGTYDFYVECNGGTYADVGEYDYASGAYDLTFDLVALSGTYCPVSPNSVGVGATIGFSGTQDLGANDFVLEVEGSVPGQFGLFFYGAIQDQIPFGDGALCVGGTFYRLGPPEKADALGFANRLVDFTVPPAGGAGAGAIDPESTWNFQWWYRDPMGPGGSGVNLSDALWVTFCP